MLTLTFKKKLASPCLEPATQSLVRNSESLAVLPPTEIHQYFSKVSVCFECLLRFGCTAFILYLIHHIVCSW